MKEFISLVLAVMTATGSMGAPMTIAHRGAPNRAPENTAQSFAIAVSLGADAVECDLRLTADGALVCHHDETTGRAWDQDLRISDTSLSELKKLKLSAGFRAAFPKFKNVSIPTFSEAVSAMGDARIFAEIKGGMECAEALSKEGEALRERMTVISYDREVIEYMRDEGYHCALLLSCETSADLTSADLPHGVDVDVNYGALTASAVDTLHRRGIKVYCYTVDGKRGYDTLSLLGVDGVTGDSFQ